MIVITAPVHEFLLHAFSEAGEEVLYVPEINHDALMEIVSKATGLVITTRIKIDRPLLDAATNLKWIGRLGSGLELIDLDYAAQKNIVCISTPEGNCGAVAEHTLGMLLSLFRHIQTAHYEVKNNIWLRNENRGTELSGKTVGIIGYGNCGSRFAKLLAGFDVQVLAHDKYKTGFANANIKEASLQEVKENADVISFHLPLTDETLYYADEAFFSSLKKQPIIINTSRGKVVNGEALFSALQHKQISGAALDVLENEKIDKLSTTEQKVFDDLKAMPNVLLTPHIAGYSHEAYYKMSWFLVEKLRSSGLL